jgi:hypothetical protein
VEALEKFSFNGSACCNTERMWQREPNAVGLNAPKIVLAATQIVVGIDPFADSRDHALLQDGEESMVSGILLAFGPHTNRAQWTQKTQSYRVGMNGASCPLTQTQER